jgi:hypothetical protein
MPDAPDQKFVPKTILNDTEKYYSTDMAPSHSEPIESHSHTSVSNHTETTPKSPEKEQPEVDGEGDKYKNFVSKPAQPSDSTLKKKVSENFNPFVENSLAKVEGWTTTVNQGKLKFSN